MGECAPDEVAPLGDNSSLDQQEGQEESAACGCGCKRCKECQKHVEEAKKHLPPIEHRMIGECLKTRNKPLARKSIALVNELIHYLATHSPKEVCQDRCDCPRRRCRHKATETRKRDIAESQKDLAKLEAKMDASCDRIPIGVIERSRLDAVKAYLEYLAHH